MSYQRFKKGGRVAKSQFLEKKSVQKLFNKKIKTDFLQKSTFFESPITHKRFIFEHSYISYGKRQKSCTLIVIFIILSYQTSPIFNSSSKSTGFFFANEEVLFNSILLAKGLKYSHILSVFFHKKKTKKKRFFLQSFLDNLAMTLKLTN